jgi:predicted permease
MEGMSGADMMMVRALLLLATLVLMVPFANVAILIYARTATRAGEMAVRSAMGATRGRVVTLLFLEALVLAGLSAGAGVACALYSMRRLESVWAIGFGGNPFWARSGQNPMALLYAVGLTVVAAVVAGVLPGLKATGRHLHAGLSRAGAGNGMRLGGAWTTLIVVQVALAVTALPSAVSFAWQVIGYGADRPTFNTEGLLQARLALGDPPSPDMPQTSRPRSRELIEEFLRRLAAEPGVAAAALASSLPGAPFAPLVPVQVEGIAAPADSLGRVVTQAAVSEDFFETLAVPVVRGRDFAAGDLEGGPSPIIVTRTFEREVLGGGNAIGRRVRFVRTSEGEPPPWREIVGVVEDLSENSYHPDGMLPQIFLPMAPGGVPMVALVIRSSAPEIATRLRALAADVDPRLNVVGVQPLGDLDNPIRTLVRTITLAVGLAVLAVVLLSCAGVYALMSFNVTLRRREIGIRSALGARPGRVILGVFSRVALQLGAGTLLGVVGAVAVDRAVTAALQLGLPLAPPIGRLGFALVILVTIGAALAAAWKPARRALQIGPMEVIRES